MRGSRPDRKRVADHWSSEATCAIGYGTLWTEIDAVQRRLNRKVSGSPDVTWVAHTLQQHLPDRLPLPAVLVLGCGRGGLECELAEHGVFSRCDAIDIAEGAIQHARLKAIELGYHHISYHVCDLNEAALPEHYYDLIWANNVIHHLDQLEHVFAQIGRALRPDGLFICNEYIGADRFQFPARQREIIHACHQLIPVEYRRLRQPTSGQQRPSCKPTIQWYAHRFVGKMRDGDLMGVARRRLRRLIAQWQGTMLVKTEPNLPTLSSVIAIDPSEAIRSAEIVTLLGQFFDIVEHKSLGGSILHFLLDGIAGNFQDETGQELLEMLFTIEDTLMNASDLGSDFAYIVAAPKRRAE